jgi:organic hydroperoxide reductase OsmC/OhrA
MKFKRDFPDLDFCSKLQWVNAHEGVSTDGVRPTVEVSCSPLFGGKKGYWSPQDLFVFSVNACVLTTFATLAEEYELPFRSYKSDARGIATIQKDGYRFVRIDLYPEIEVADERTRKRTERLIHVAARTCMITRSFQGEVRVFPTLTVIDND